MTGKQRQLIRDIAIEQADLEEVCFSLLDASPEDERAIQFERHALNYECEQGCEFCGMAVAAAGLNES